MTTTAFDTAIGALVGAAGGGGGWLAASAGGARWAATWRPPVASALTGVLCAVLLVRTGAGGGAAAGAEVAAYSFLAIVAVLLSSIDIATHRLPDTIVLPAYPIGGVLLLGAAVVVGEPGRLWWACAGSCLLAAGYLTLVLVRPGALGLGDVKVAGLVGGYLGWAGPAAFVVGAGAAFVLGGLAAAVLLLTGRATRASPIAFGPWIFAGAFVGILCGRDLVNGYVSLLSAAQWA